MRRLIPVFVATLVMTSTWGWPAAAHREVRGATARPMLVSLEPGVEITPIINSGDRVGDDFQYTGVPDGIGMYASAPDRLEVFTNHELSYRYGDPAWSRVSHLTLDPQGNVVSASYAVDGTERYEYFCSSTMDVIDGTPWYFTGEEWFASPRGGTSIAINALTGNVIRTPQFGSLNHENIVPLHGLSRAVVYLSEDSFRLRSQAYAYFADDFPGAIHGEGAFAVWVPDDQGDGDPSTNDLAKGETLSGRFVTIPHAERYTGLQLNEKAEALGSFNFVRIEDAATDASKPGVMYFSDTGANKAETKHGRLYRMTFDPAHPRRASLEVVLDGDAGDDIVNPDNLGIDQARPADPGGSQRHRVRLQPDPDARPDLRRADARCADGSAALGDRARRWSGGLGVERGGRRQRLLRSGRVAPQRAGAPHEDPAAGHRPRDRLRRRPARPAGAASDPRELKRTGRVQHTRFHRLELDGSSSGGHV